MIVTCSYTEEADRRRLYWDAWRIMARYGVTLSDDDRRALMDIKKSFYRDEAFDPMAIGYVERLSDFLLKTKAYAY